MIKLLLLCLIISDLLTIDAVNDRKIARVQSNFNSVLSQKRTLENDDYPEKMEIKLSLDKETTLLLVKDRGLYGKGYIEQEQTRFGTRYVGNKPKFCHYTSDDMVVALSVCNGGFDGFVYDEEGNKWIIEPTKNNDLHLLTKIDAKKAPRVVHKNKRAMMNITTRYMELYVYSDAKLYERIGEGIYDFVATAANQIRHIYLNSPSTNFLLDLQLVGQYAAKLNTGFWNTPVYSNGKVSADQYLFYFNYFLQHTAPNNTIKDVVALFSGLGMNGNDFGAANQGTLCQNIQSSFVTYMFDSAASSGVMGAHLLGHLFGMKHDGPGGSTACTSANYLMAANNSDPTNSIFSSCSFSDFDTMLNDQQSLCLTTTPSYIAFCGNGFIDDNEDCDCGAQTASCDPCCDTTTCRLKSGAVCSANFTGVCCINCKVASTSYKCRDPLTECQAKTICDGVSPKCGVNYLPTGSSCNGGLGSCYMGQCISIEDQCKVYNTPKSSLTKCDRQLTLNQQSGYDYCGILFCSPLGSTDCQFFIDGTIGSTNQSVRVVEGTPCEYSNNVPTKVCFGGSCKPVPEVKSKLGEKNESYRSILMILYLIICVLILQ